jgi:hypothetical protein
MKAYTDINQSKKLAEILPPESADMAWYPSYDKEGYSIRMLNDTYPLDIIGEEHDEIPAWSLSALIEMIRKLTALDLLIDGRGCRCHCRDKHEGKFYGTDNYCDTPIDACIEVILKLHKQKIL